MKYLFKKHNINDLMNIREISVYLRIPLKTVYRLAKQEKLKGVKVGKHWRFLKKNIDDYLKNGKRSNAKTQSFERRAYPRINSNFTCHYSVNLQPFRFVSNVGIIQNLSTSGILLFLNNGDSNVVRVDDPIHLDFLLILDNKEELKINLTGKIIRKSQNGLGIKFKKINKELQDKLIEYAS